MPGEEKKNPFGPVVLNTGWHRDPLGVLKNTDAWGLFPDVLIKLALDLGIFRSSLDDSSVQL